MIRLGWRVAAGAVALAALGGCASTSPKAAADEVARTTLERSGHRLHWRWEAGTKEDDEAKRAIDGILARELTADGAVQVALLASPKLRAKLEELSIAQADLVQAGLLKNPVFGFGTTAWESEHIDPNLFATVEQDFLDIVTMPMRKRVAKTELEATKLEVADQVLEIAADVRAAFYRAQAAEQVAALRKLVDEAAQTSAAMAARQHEAGNMSELALTSERTLAAQTALDRRRSETDATVAREELNKLMGTWGPRTAWRMGTRLPELPAAEPSLERLETQAIEQRLDLGAARRNLQALTYTVSMVKTTRWVGVVNVNVEAGRLRHNRRFAFGPSVAIEIPLFDRREAAVARVEAHQRQAEDELHALAIDIRADVRSSRARVLATRANALDYATSVVPLRERVVRLSQQRYDAMLLGVYQLLQAKQAEFTAYGESIEALRDYWIARSDLERAVGGRIGTAASAARSSSPSSPGTSTVAPPSHHNH